MSNEKSLSDQVAVVTGGGRGIGRVIAQLLAREGAQVVVTARSQDQLDETVALIQAEGHACTAFPMDVTQPEQVRTTIDAIVTQFGAIDLLVNNAGVGAVGAMPWEVDVDLWWHVMEVNVKGVFLCSQAVLSGMIERQRGRIINIGSNAALFPNSMASEYAVSKAALLRLTDSLAEATQDEGVYVFAISPGLVMTEMTRDVPVFKDLPPSDWTPIEKAGELCVLLASGVADALTGRYIHVTDDDIHAMIAESDAIIADDRHALRLNR